MPKRTVLKSQRPGPAAGHKGKCADSHAGESRDFAARDTRAESKERHGG